MFFRQWSHKARRNPERPSAPGTTVRIISSILFTLCSKYWNIAQTVGFLVLSALGPFNQTGTIEIHSYLNQLASKRTSLPKFLLY